MGLNIFDIGVPDKYLFNKKGVQQINRIRTILYIISIDYILYTWLLPLIELEISRINEGFFSIALPITITSAPA